jgi:hypothetical protein
MGACVRPVFFKNISSGGAENSPNKKKDQLREMVNFINNSHRQVLKISVDTPLPKNYKG